MNRIITISILSLSVSFGYGQTYVNDHYYSGIDISASGYGSGYASSSSGAVFYNPTFSFMEAEGVGTYFSVNTSSGALSNSFHAAYNLDSSSRILVGLNLQRVTGIIGTNGVLVNSSSINLSNVTELTSTNQSGVVSYVRALNSSFVLGGSLRILSGGIDSYGSMIGYGLDLSASKTFDRLKVSLVLNDVSVGLNKWSYVDPVILAQSQSADIPLVSIEKALPRLNFIGEYDVFADSSSIRVKALAVVKTTFDGRGSGLFRVGSSTVSSGLFVKCEYERAYLTIGVKDILTYSAGAVHLGANVGYRISTVSIGYGFDRGIGYAVDSSVHSFSLIKSF